MMPHLTVSGSLLDYDATSNCIKQSTGLCCYILLYQAVYWTMMLHRYQAAYWTMMLHLTVSSSLLDYDATFNCIKQPTGL